MLRAQHHDGTGTGVGHQPTREEEAGMRVGQHTLAERQQHDGYLIKMIKEVITRGSGST
jgi:hypothetical protein